MAGKQSTNQQIFQLLKGLNARVVNLQENMVTKEYVDKKLQGLATRDGAHQLQEGQKKIRKQIEELSGIISGVATTSPVLLRL